MSNEGSDGDPDGPNHAESDAGLSDRESSDRGQDVVSHAGSTDEERPDSDDDAGADGANESDGGQDVVSHAGSNDEDGPDGDDDGAGGANESESGEYQTPDEAASDPESSVADSILSKKTLKFGDEPTPTTDLEATDSEDEFQCSQVSSGWLGKAYNEDSRQNKMRQLMEDSKKRIAKECTKMNVSDMDSSRYYYWSQIPFLAYCILLPIAYCILLPSASCILILNQFPILPMAYCILLLKSSPITTQWQSWPGPMTTHFLWFFLCKPIAVLPHAGRHRGHLGDWPRPVQPQQVPPVLWLLREELDDLGGLRGWEVGHQEALSLVGPNSW